jgi:hypothetical protein
MDKCDGPFGSGLKSEHYRDEGIRVVRLQNIRATGFDNRDAAFLDEDYYRNVLGGGHDVLVGDLLIAGLGDDNNTVGRACVAPEDLGPTMVKADCFRFRVARDKIVPEFLAQQLCAGGRFDAGVLSSGSTRSRIPLSIMASRMIALPPLSEQLEIATWVRSADGTIGKLLVEAEAANDLLLERRSALISAAVTGKINVGVVGISASVTPDIRSFVAGEIIERLSSKKTFGRVKFQKVIYLAEVHADISEIGGNYLRAAAGPLDRDLIDTIEAGLIRTGHISIERADGAGSQVTYKVYGRKAAHRNDLASALGERTKLLDQIISAVTDLDTRATEAVATLYAVWNDFLFDGKEPTDDEIVSGVLYDWHPEKRDKFRADDLHTRLGWMRRHSLTPSGKGPRTTTGRLFP